MSDEWAFDEAVGWYNLEDDPATIQETALLEQLIEVRGELRRLEEVVMTSVDVYAATAAPITANYVARLNAAEANWGAAVRRYLSAQGLNPGETGLPTGPRLELDVSGSAVAAGPHDGGDPVLRQHPTGGVNDTVVTATLEVADTLADDDPTGVRDVLGGVGGGHDMIKHHNVTDVNTLQKENAALRAWVERHLAAHPEEIGFT